MSGPQPANAKPADSKQAPIQSLSRAMAILQAIAHRREGVGLSELSKEVELHSSTTFHLVKSLVALGCARQDEDTKRYHVGPMLFGIAAAALDEVELARTAEPFLDELALRTGETSHLAIRSGQEIVVIARKEAASPFRISERAGVPRPAHATALGKVLVAAMPQRSRQVLLDALPMPALTAKTITERRRLERELNQVAQSGIGYDDGEFHAEVRCMAVPVIGFTGNVVGAIGISAPIYRLTLDDLKDKAGLLHGIADDLSRALGFHAGRVAEG